MHRSSRSIETFDISLMAVVTKAMGAFLVMMLLLMPYYSSGPIGTQAATDLAKKIDQVDQKIKDVISKLSNAAPEDLRKQLEDALKLLEEARKLIAELKRANDALQAQVKRLEESVAALLAQVTSLQAQVRTLQQENAALQTQLAKIREELETAQRALAQYRGNRIWATVAGFDCKDIIALELYSQTAQVRGSDGKPSRFLLNFNGLTNEQISSSNFSMVMGGGLTVGNYAVVLRILNVNVKAEPLSDGNVGIKLKRASADCNGVVGLYVDGKGENKWNTAGTVEIKKGNTSLLVYVVTLAEDGFRQPNKETQDQMFQWWWDHNTNAEKLD